MNKVFHRHRVGVSVSVNVSSTTPSNLAWRNNLEHKRSYLLFAIHPVNGTATCSILYRFLSCSRHIERIDLAIHRCTPFPKSSRVRFIHEMEWATGCERMNHEWLPCRMTHAVQTHCLCNIKSLHDCGDGLCFGLAQWMWPARVFAFGLAPLPVGRKISVQIDTSIEKRSRHCRPPPVTRLDNNGIVSGYGCVGHTRRAKIHSLTSTTFFALP
mmetsp:Transcript_10033/g.25052  ORF Transcript_10033/g.25052 Transcript_10033/m.25052 type:complete len:213 (+) Transcript_10033:295-933(+)